MAVAPVASQEEATPEAESTIEPGIEGYDATELPAPELPEQRLPALSVPDADFSAPPPVDGRQRHGTPGESDVPAGEGFVPGSSTRLESETTETREVFANPDGSRTAVMSTRPERFRDEQGDWQEIDLTLVEEGDALRPVAAPLAVRVPKNPSAGMVRLQDSRGELVVSYPTVFAGGVDAPLPEGAAAVAQQASAGAAELESKVVATATGFEQSVVVPDSAGPSSYQLSFTLPTGVTASQDQGWVIFTDGAGEIVGRFGSGLAFDSGPQSAPGAVSTTLVGQTGVVATVRVEADETWWNDPSRVGPLTIDPTYEVDTGDGSIGGDTWVRDGLGSQWSTAYLNTGFIWGLYVYRSLVRWDLPSWAPDENVVVSSTEMDVYTTNTGSCSARDFAVYKIDGNDVFDSNTVWSNQPDIVTPALATASFSKGRSGCDPDSPDGWVTIDLQQNENYFQGFLDGSVDDVFWTGLALRGVDEADNTEWWTQDSEEATSGNAPKLRITYNMRPDVPVRTAPVDGAIVQTRRPTFTVNAVTDPEGNQVKYWYRVFTGVGPTPNGRYVDSGWTTSTSWTPPAGALQGALTDGTAWNWIVYSSDGVTTPMIPQTSSAFAINTFGSGSSDSVGPVSVDLRTGGAFYSQPVPSLPSVGGGLGVGLTYSSQDHVPERGLTGYYYSDADQDQVFDAGDPLRLQRNDTQVGFSWDSSGPSPVVGGSYFLTRWKGSFTAPSAGDYVFGGSHDNGLKIKVNGNTVLDQWGTINVYTDWGSSVSLTAGQTVPIEVEYSQIGGYAYVNLMVKATSGGSETIAAQQVPADWLTPEVRSDRMLPQGWTLGVPSQSGALYDRARIEQDQIVFEGPYGMPSTWLRTSSGGWKPFDGSDKGTLSVDGQKRPTLTTADGTVHQFNATGALQSVKAASDSVGDASPEYTWTALGGDSTKMRVTTITDPVSDRYVELTYKNGSNCSTVFADPPAGMLCKIEYKTSGGTVLYRTDVTYTGSTDETKRVLRVINPGSAITDFWYNSDGQVVEVRDELASDAVAAGVRGSGLDGYATRWKINYDSSSVIEDRKVTQVQAPAPTQGASRPGHSYSYSSSSTDVSVDGLTQPVGYFRRVYFDGDGRVTEERDAAGRATTTVWDADNERVRYVDSPGSVRIGYVYDTKGRLTDTWGPAPTSYFSGESPGQGHSAATIPRSTTSYDEDASGNALKGLDAIFWENLDLSGDDDTRMLGIEATTAGEINKDWSTGSPTGISSGDNWSGRLSGEIDFDATGTYSFELRRLSRARVYIGDQLVFDQWTDPSVTGGETVHTANYSVTETGPQRIMVEVAEESGNAKLVLNWKPPGESTYVAVPGTELAPGYSLATTNTDPDFNDSANGPPGLKTRTEYDSPWLGRADASVVDPSGLALSTDETFETAGSNKYGRRTVRTLPGANTSSTLAYYTDTQTVDDPCTAGTQSINQGGALKTSTGATPASGSAIVNEAIYDDHGRVRATRWGTDSWTCHTYDSRARLIQRDIQADSRTVTWDFDVSDNPTVTSVNDSTGAITTTIDLLGRPVQTVDVWNKTTTFTYDQPGRLTQRSGPEGTQAFTYDATGRLTQQKLDTLVVANVTYDSTTGRVQSYSYPSGTGNGGNGTDSANLTYDTYGSLTGLTWRDPSQATITSDSLTRSIGGRAIDQSIDGTDPYTSGANFTYDAAGRLTDSRVPGHRYQYAYAGSGGCGANAAAGNNTNRTSMTIDGGTPVTYCYDNADRLTSTSQSGMGTITYDSRGNTTQLGSETYTYDNDNRHKTTAISGGVTVTYTRDATDGIVERKEDSTVIARYSGPAVLDTSGNVIERVIALPGGVILTKRSAGDVWSYPNIRGEIVSTANASGAKQGSTFHYDPYGVNLSTLPDNAAGMFDVGWTGQRYTEHANSAHTTIQMGARAYSPTLGRFIEADPIEGGCANDYSYPGDPVNGNDYDGTSCRGANNVWVDWVKKIASDAGRWSGATYIPIKPIEYRSRFQWDRDIRWRTRYHSRNGKNDVYALQIQVRQHDRTQIKTTIDLSPIIINRVTTIYTNTRTIYDRTLLIEVDSCQWLSSMSFAYVFLVAWSHAR